MQLLAKNSDVKESLIQIEAIDWYACSYRYKRWDIKSLVICMPRKYHEPVQTENEVTPHVIVRGSTDSRQHTIKVSFA